MSKPSSQQLQVEMEGEPKYSPELQGQLKAVGQGSLNHWS